MRKDRVIYAYSDSLLKSLRFFRSACQDILFKVLQDQLIHVAHANVFALEI